MPLPRARLKATPEDFVVEEMPLYDPSGEGEHLYVRFTKRDLTTDAAVRAIAGALGVPLREVGVAGMKDKVAVTTQTISLLAPRNDPSFDDRARALTLDGITIHEARRHGNKLKTGHLAGNRFTLVLRGVDPARAPEIVASLERIGREGLPNAYGSQRFGRDRDNADRARAWLSGNAPAPRDPRLRRLHWSALQSAMFNEVLRRRVEAGTWAVPLEGDLVKRRTSGGLFVCTDVQTDRARAEAGEIDPTGPMFGVKMREPEGAPRDLERSVLAEFVGDRFDLAVTRALGEGTRRALRVGVEGMRVELVPAPPEPDAREQGARIRVYFVLPKGAYATTVLSEVVDVGETATPPDASAALEGSPED